MKAIDRLYQYFDNKGIKPTALEKKINLSNGYFSGMRKKKADIGEAVMNKIIEYFRDINPEWLLTGHGPMLRETATMIEVLPPEPAGLPVAAEQGIQTTKMLDIIDKQATQISLLHNEIKELANKIHELTMQLINTPGESGKQKERSKTSPGSALRRP